MLIVVFFFFLEHTRFFREYTSIAWLVRVNHKHAVACCIVVLSIQREESSPEVDGFCCCFFVVVFCCYFFGYYFFVTSWLLALYKLPANISFCFFISSDKHLSDMFCLSEMSCLLDKFLFLYVVFIFSDKFFIFWIYIFFSSSNLVSLSV